MRWAITSPETPVQITRQASLSEQQFLGCVSAFVDSLSAELNSAAMYLRKLEGQTKGAAFAFEMALDRHRYGALTVLDRWATLVRSFRGYLKLHRYPGIVEDAYKRVEDAENILRHANDLMDAGGTYAGAIVEACVLAFQSIAVVFQEERQAAEQSAKLGPMLPEEFREARAVFLQDLAAR